MPLLAPCVDIWTMRDVVVRAGMGNHADSQDLTRDDLEDIWRELWQTRRADCYASIKAYHLGQLRQD